jgi:hypothetical protein
MLRPRGGEAGAGPAAATKQALGHFARPHRSLDSGIAGFDGHFNAVGPRAFPALPEISGVGVAVEGTCRSPLETSPVTCMQAAFASSAVSHRHRSAAARSSNATASTAATTGRPTQRSVGAAQTMTKGSMADVVPNRHATGTRACRMVCAPANAYR